ncbi:MAG: alpha/beta hydrolase [Alphaproteobacteria bacterium]|nr:alpha/beta hydrolase [Alphaproteobacteria bacterium]
MIKSFDLPVTADETVRVVYQQPDSDKTEPTVKPARTKVKSRHEDLYEDDLSLTPPRKPVIIMMHGFPGGHKGGCDDLFGELEYRFEGLGYPSIRFDFRGCGESSGREEDFCIESALADLNAVILWAQHDAGHRSIVLLGESCGATIALLGNRPDAIMGNILLWPALKLKETSFKDLFTQESRIESITRDQPYTMFEGHKMGSHFINDIYTLDLTTTLENITAPTLIQHGTADDEVSLEQVHYARDHLAGLIDIGIFEGGGHGLRDANMRQYMFMNIRHFLERLFKKLDLQPKN